MLTSWWFKPLAGLILFAIVSGGGYFAYRHFVHGIQQTQITQDENKQLKQMADDIKALQDKTNALDEANSAILEKLNAKNDAVKAKSDSISTYIHSPQAQKSDRDSSEVLKETIRRLKSAQ